MNNKPRTPSAYSGTNADPAALVVGNVVTGTGAGCVVIAVADA